LILQQMVQQQLRIATFRVRSLKDIAAASSASFALVLLSQGVLEDPDFALQIGQMRAAAVEEGGVAGLGPNAGRSLAKAYQALLGILALPLTPHASSGILERQVTQICQRFGNLEDLLERRTQSNQSTNRTTTADEVGVADISMSLTGFDDVDLDTSKETPQ
ncbi:unnamed protein product, partial [Symbiodinium sp. KB8]